MRIFVLILVLLVSTACSSELRDLNDREKNDLTTVRQERYSCFVNQSSLLDDGRSNVAEVVSLVKWKCQTYDGRIQQMLKDMKLKTGDAWQYTNQMNIDSEKEITELIIRRRNGTLQLGN